jgi:hypothetical protein
MERFDLEELSAMLGSSIAVRSKGRDLVNRLESLYQSIGELLVAVKYNSVSLEELASAVSKLTDNLNDTETIIHLLLREKKLMSKLAEVDRVSSERENDKQVDQFMDEMFGGQLDPEIRKRVEQAIELNQLIDSVTVASDGESRVSRLEKLKKLVSSSKAFSKSEVPVFKAEPSKRRWQEERANLEQEEFSSEPRPYRRVNALGPTSKGEAYKTPRKRS